MKIQQSRYVILTVIIICLLCVLGILAIRNRSSVPIVSSTNTSMRYEIVTTLAQQEKGLGGRAVIPDNYGMLFVFAKKDSYGFWMKDMLAPIDIIWLADDGTIVKIDAHVDTSTYPKAYYPPVPVGYVLETKAGFVERHGWNEGEKIMIPTSYSPSDK